MSKNPNLGSTTSGGSGLNSYVPEGNFLYFYHPDHLGSTAYVTDGSGQLYEHMEYFPFGETWADQRSNTQRVPYLFTGKEYDEETGLYYFGARYYDPRTSVWESADPALAAYLSGKINGGVFNAVNLNLYSYSYNNPVILLDPTGLAPLTKALLEKFINTSREDMSRGAFHNMVGHLFEDAVRRSLGGPKGSDSIEIENALNALKNPGRFRGQYTYLSEFSARNEKPRPIYF